MTIFQDILTLRTQWQSIRSRPVDFIDALSCNRREFGMENNGFWRTVWRLRPMNNDKRTGSGSKLFLLIESLWQNQYWICLDREQTGPWAPDCYSLEILQISIQFPILFGRHYGRNAQARPPSCSIFLPMRHPVGKRTQSLIECTLRSILLWETEGYF